MTQQEVNRILEVLQSKDWSEHYLVNDTSLKKNIWFYINDIPEFSFVKGIINNDLEKVNTDYECLDWLTLLIYKKDDFFGLHKDDYGSLEDKIIFSGGYLLNDDYKGGDFIINGQRLVASVGELFMFDRKHEHEVKPLESGVRYSLHFAIKVKNINKTLI